jgi:hypothetical protein
LCIKGGMMLWARRAWHVLSLVEYMSRTSDHSPWGGEIPILSSSCNLLPSKSWSGWKPRTPWYVSFSLYWS